MHGCVGDRILLNEFMLLLNVPVILVAVVPDAMLDGPAGLRSLLPPVRGLRVPVGRTVPCFDRGIFLTGIALPRHRNQRGSNPLAPARL